MSCLRICVSTMSQEINIIKKYDIAEGVCICTILQEMYKNDISGDVYCRWCEYNIAGAV